jgi:hypothetical protein
MMVDPALDHENRGRVRTLTTAKAHVGTRPAASLPRRSVAENEIGTTGTCVTLSTTEMHATRSKTGAKSETALSANYAIKGTMITTIPVTTSPTDTIPQKEDTVRRGVKAFSHDLKRVHWPLNFKPSGIEKYDGSTNTAEWLMLYQLVIKAVGRDSYVMANNLPVCLSSSAKTWLLGLPTRSVRS